MPALADISSERGFPDVECFLCSQEVTVWLHLPKGKIYEIHKFIKEFIGNDKISRVSEGDGRAWCVVLIKKMHPVTTQKSTESRHLEDDSSSNETSEIQSQHSVNDSGLKGDSKSEHASIVSSKGKCSLLLPLLFVLILLVLMFLIEPSANKQYLLLAGTENHKDVICFNGFELDPSSFTPSFQSQQSIQGSLSNETLQSQQLRNTSPESKYFPCCILICL